MNNKNSYTEKMNELFRGINDTDLLKKYIADIRNIKKLDKEMISNISNMSNEDKMKIIIAYNDMIEAFNHYIITINNENLK